MQYHSSVDCLWTYNGWMTMEFPASNRRMNACFCTRMSMCARPDQWRKTTNIDRYPL